MLLTLKDAEVLKESIIDRTEVTLLLLKVLKANSTVVLAVELEMKTSDWFIEVTLAILILNMFTDTL